MYRKSLVLLLACACLLTSCSLFGIEFGKKSVSVPPASSILTPEVAESTASAISSAASDAALSAEEEAYAQWVVGVYDKVSDNAAEITKLATAKDLLSTEWTANVTKCGQAVLEGCAEIDDKVAPARFAPLHDNLKSGSASYKSAIDQFIDMASSGNFSLLKAKDALDMMGEGTKSFKEAAEDIKALKELLAKS